MPGRNITVTVDGAVSLIINTEQAVAADYLIFIGGIIDLLAKDKAALESDARKNGRTLESGFSGMGSVSQD